LVCDQKTEGILSICSQSFPSVLKRRGPIERACPRRGGANRKEVTNLQKKKGSSEWFLAPRRKNCKKPKTTITKWHPSTRVPPIRRGKGEMFIFPGGQHYERKGKKNKLNYRSRRSFPECWGEERKRVEAGDLVAGPWQGEPE